MIFFQFKFSLTILPVCTIRQSVVTDSVTYAKLHTILLNIFAIIPIRHVT